MSPRQGEKVVVCLSALRAVAVGGMRGLRGNGGPKHRLVLGFLLDAGTSLKCA